MFSHGDINPLFHISVSIETELKPVCSFWKFAGGLSCVCVIVQILENVVTSVGTPKNIKFLLKHGQSLYC